MKLSLKTVTGVSFHLELDESITIAETKGKIAEAQGENFPKDRQVLIYKGQVLKDDTTLKDNSITEDGFMVVTVLKGKAAAPAAKPAATATTTTTSAEKKEDAKPAAEAKKDEPMTPAAPAAKEAEPPTAGEAQAQASPTPMETEGTTAAADETGSPASHYQSSASNLATGSALESSINMICDMGFEKDLVIKAMRAAFNNPDRAVEYLMTGIPEQPQAPPPQPGAGGDAAPPQAQAATGGTPPAATGGAAPAAPSPTAAAGAGVGPNTQPLNMFPQGIPGMGGQGGAGGEGSPGAAQAQSELSFLRNNPQFQALRQMVQANPQILQPMLQELGKQNPHLLQLINSNQGDFLRMLNEQSMDPAAAAAGGAGGMPGMEGGMDMPQNVVSVTAEEKEAIDRLEAMGFDRALCIEAFFACDKNEALAANYLLEHAQEDFQ